VRFRSVDLAELDAFAAIGDAETARAYRSYLLSSMEAGETSPERWFAAIDDDDRIVGRIVYWSLPGAAEVSLDVFALPWADEERAPFALDFLSSSLESLRSTGVRAVEYEHHEPDPDRHTPARLLDTLATAGFHQARTTVRFELSPVVAVTTGARVSFEGEADGRSLQDFADVVARCAAAGADTGVTGRRPDADVEAAAMAFVSSTDAMRGGRELWRLARIGDEVVGVILPTANDGGPVLNYVGVVPQHRGHRVVDELLAETARLQAGAGAARVRADSDLDNQTMHAAFARAGWQPFGRRTTYRLEFDS
jgi:hypothetical protein